MEDEEDDDDDVIITTERPESEMQEDTKYGGDETQDQSSQYQERGQSQMDGQQGYGYSQNQQGFGGMNNFNPMMGMQNGMGMPNFMGMQNMMGKYRNRTFHFKPRSRLSGGQGMGMDPSMMFNGGFGGMGGMNDMSSMMNMMNQMNGMGGFGGMPGMGNMGGGGAGGPNFFHGNGGYNQQQNFGGSPMNQPNFHHNRQFGGGNQRPYNNRGFGNRGRGYQNRGRGGWQNQQFGHAYQGQGQNPNFVNQQHQQSQNFQGNDESFDASAQQGARRASPSYEAMKAPADTNHDGSPQRPSDVEGEVDTNKVDDVIANQAGGDVDTDQVNGEAEYAVKPTDDVDGDGEQLFVHVLPIHMLSSRSQLR